MTLRQTIQAAPGKATELIAKLSATSNQAVKTREALFAQLSDELARYVDLEEQHLLPLLRKHPDTKDLAASALKGNKDLRAALAKLAARPKDDDGFLAELAELSKGFQQHVRNERNELLPAVLKALSDEEAATVAAGIEGAVADAEQAKRDEKREQAAQARREAEEAEQAAAAERAAVAQAEKAKRDQKREEQAQAKRQADQQAEAAEQAAAAQRAMADAQKEAERASREATDKVVEGIERGVASVQDRAREATASLAERAQQVASDAREAMTIYGEASRKVVEDMQAVRTSSAVSMGALSEVRSAWVEWFGKAARANAEASQKLIQCRSVKQVAELQQELATRAMRDWMEGSTKVLQIAQRTSKEASSPLDGRLSEVA